MNTRLSTHIESGFPAAVGDFEGRQRTDHTNIIDLLRTAPPTESFSQRVKGLCLSPALEQKILRSETSSRGQAGLEEMEEKELAGEVLMLRHRFTEIVFENRFFRQAALSIIQNIYLFRQRRIFFGTPREEFGEAERREALLLFTGDPTETSVPLAKAFQHFIVARVWDRILSQASDSFLDSRPFAELHRVVEQLNTLRNIYMLLTVDMVGKMTAKISRVYRQSVTNDDARQIGSFGIARAAYRYHPSMGLRFSTYASHWVLKEIQRQALDGRLIRISSNLVEKLSRQAKAKEEKADDSAYEELCRATAQLSLTTDHETGWLQRSTQDGLDEQLAVTETSRRLTVAMTTLLSAKSADVVMRRYGLGPYQGKEQSVKEIADIYGVTRSSIYQLEQTALRRLKQFLTPAD